MDKELCFYVEDKELYLEQVLVDYNDVPIFFVCKDEAGYYAVLCSDIEELSYIVVKLPEKDLFALLHGSLSMREVFTKQESYWEIVSGEEIELDKVVHKSMREMDCSILPEAGACFEVLTDEVSAYVEKFDEAFLLREQFEDLGQEVSFNECCLLEIELNRCEFELIERYVEIYKCLLEQKMAVDFQNIDIAYNENMRTVFGPNKIIPEMEHSEEWKSTEIEKLAYAA